MDEERAALSACGRRLDAPRVQFFDAKMRSGLSSSTGGAELVAAMIHRGFDQPLIEKVCCKNWVRVLQRTLEGRMNQTVREASAAAACVRLVIAI
jgi:hypothetical protein